MWRAFLDLPCEKIQALGGILSQEESARAARFHFDKHRKRYIVSHGYLRRILSFYTGRGEKELRFSRGPYGKPSLAPEPGNESIRFNFGSSYDLALYAVALDREVGVDVERLDRALAYESISKHFFSTEENAAITGLPEDIRRRAFFNCWTRKEAFLKATGQGLSFPLNRFVVSVTPGRPAVIQAVSGDPQAASRWTLHEISPAEGYVGSLAVEGRGWRLERFEASERGIDHRHRDAAKRDERRCAEMALKVLG